MTSNGTGDAEALREEIRRTRMELGETMEALAAKADVKARLRDSAEQARERVREQAGQARERVREQTAQTVARVRGQAVYQAGAARVHANETRAAVRRDPVPWAVVAAGALATVVVLLIVRGRRR
ncbi:DUF3618 domain-containing protein [Micromonospora sp. WMMD882]|uniref:DUF3618 domain-containing protein n=1 Tax=Micromonospora sp. WMMD882 TaxID=3015151 RepID=UPI00248D1736|nr:DUF3618 domain-containing protein [Micromonospora sp. WMMD882]WBB81446.1 DUF3618 domain-containing protein [Micromonospora sp. WMMD882]